MSTIAIRCRGLEKGYRSGDVMVRALQGIDLEAEAGELLMIVGPSGCGKTTLLSLLCGVLRADAGSVELFGTDLTTLSEPERVAFRSAHIGFIFQQFNLIPTLTARENTTLPLVLGGYPYAEALKAADVLLERLGIGPRAHHFPPQLSGGQQQRIAIARALVHKPRILVCDEPTASLDATTGATTMNLLREVATSPDRCVVVVTHDPRIFGYADRIVTMDDGRITEIRKAQKIDSPQPHP